MFWQRSSCNNLEQPAKTCFLGITCLISFPQSSPMLLGPQDSVWCGAGCLAYGSVAFLAARQYASQAARKQQSQRDKHFSRYAVLAGGTVLASTSGYLLYLLGTVFQGETCVWCLTSATLSFGIFFSALRGFTMRYLEPKSSVSLQAWATAKFI